MSNKEEVQKDIRKFDSLSAISTTAGGKLLIKSLQKDCVSCIDELSAKVKTAPHMELVAIISKLTEKLTLLRVLNRAPKLKKFALDELEFILKEELE
jgi:hypothetical protein